MMASGPSIEKILDELREVERLYKDRNFPAVVKRARALLQAHPGIVTLLVTKALAIAQLDEGATDIAEWREESKALTDAVALDPSSTRALNALAAYLFASEDNAAAALDHYDRSIASSKAALRRAYIGRIKCLMDLASIEGVTATERQANRKAALLTLQEALKLFPNDARLAEIAAEYELNA